MKLKRILLIAFLLGVLACTSFLRQALSPEIDVNGKYTSKEEVSLYIDTYGDLPSNYITKAEAKELGWDSNAGNLWDVAEGMSIGGDVFGNREGLLPEDDDRIYYECDIDYEGGYRNSKRIVYSNENPL